jgi:hypothetical protein
MPYLRVTVRIPSPLAAQLRDMAKLFGWQLADFQRTLTCLGATFLLLSQRDEAKQQAATALMGGMRLLRLSRSFSLNPKPNRRPYAFRYHFRGSTLITLSVPESFRDLIAIYANLAHVSRNQAYSKSLQQGLLAYLKAQEDTLAAART